DLVEHRNALALQVRGHAEQRADRHHAGAADAGDQDVVVTFEAARSRLGHASRRVVGFAGSRRFGRLAHFAAVYGHEAGAKSLDTGIVLVAARLVDHALTAELGLQRLHRDAVGFDAAIAAALAN